MTPIGTWLHNARTKSQGKIGAHQLTHLTTSPSRRSDCDEKLFESNRELSGELWEDWQLEMRSRQLIEASSA